MAMPRNQECSLFLMPTVAQQSPPTGAKRGGCVCRLPLDGARLQPKLVRYAYWFLDPD